MNIKNVSIGLTLVCVALHSAALTIGPAQGAAWIGRPLDLRIPVIIDMPSDAAALCVHADVYYADTQQDPSRIQIQQEPTDQPETLRLRLRSGTLIDEPVVTINLRVGCEDKSMRRFVLLADLPLASDPPPERTAADLPVPLVTPPPAEAPAANAPVPVASAATNSVERRASVSPDGGSGAAASNPRPAVRQSTERAPAARMAAPKVKPPPTAAASKPARAQGGSRLQLDPLEILLDRVKTLEIATATPPVETVSKESELLLRMESDLKSLREQTAKNEATLAALQKRLEQAESDRVSAELFYGLLAVVVVCAAAVVALWQRRRAPVAAREEPMEDEPEPYEAQFLRKTLEAENFAPPIVVRQPPPPTQAAGDSVVPVDVNLLDLDEPPWPDTSVTALRRL